MPFHLHNSRPLECIKSPAVNQLRRHLLLVALTLLLPACRSRPAATLPAELIGTWGTDHPKYAGLYFQINPGSFAFSTPDGMVETYTLTGYDPVETNLRRNKQVKHLLGGTRPVQETEFALLYDPTGRGAIRFANRGPMVWLRSSTPTQRNILPT